MALNCHGSKILFKIVWNYPKLSHMVLNSPIIVQNSRNSRKCYTYWWIKLDQVWVKKRAKIINNCPNWYKMDQTGPTWSIMVQHVPIWYNKVQSGPVWSFKVHNFQVKICQTKITNQNCLKTHSLWTINLLLDECSPSYV